MTGNHSNPRGIARDHPFPVVCIGASAGDIEALSKVIGGLNPEFGGQVLIVLHTTVNSVLPALLSRKSPLKVEYALDGQALERGQVLVAPPDHHLLITDEHVVLSRGPKQNLVRPAIHALFRSAANGNRAEGPRVANRQSSGG